jgi:hypothetical protein
LLNCTTIELIGTNKAAETKDVADAEEGCAQDYAVLRTHGAGLEDSHLGAAPVKQL